MDLNRALVVLAILGVGGVAAYGAWTRSTSPKRPPVAASPAPSGRAGTAAPRPSAAAVELPEAPDDLRSPDELVQLLRDGRRDEVEKLLRERARYRRPGDWVSSLNAAVEALGAAAARTPRLLDDWCAASPRSWIPFFVRGSRLVDWAWEARGSGVADTVTNDGARKFTERLESARTDLEKAQALNPSQPFAMTRILPVAMGLGLDDATTDAYFRAAVKAAPLYFAPYNARRNYLAPKWHGSVDAMLEFCEASTKAHPESAAIPFLLVEAHRDLAETAARDPAAYLRQPGLKRSLDEILERVYAAYPRSRAAESGLRLGRLAKDDAWAQKWRPRAAEAAR